VSDNYVIGLDLGTSGVRAMLYTLEGVEVASTHGGYPLETPRSGWAEQDPALVWARVISTLAELAPQLPAGGRVAALGLSTIFHTLLAVDAAGEPLTRSMIWADTRAHRQVDQLREQLDARAVYQRTGCPLHPMYLPGKIQWLREERPADFARVASFGSIKEDLIARLTGRRVVDKSVASASGLFNLHQNRWDAELMAAVGVTPAQLSEVVEPTDVVGGLLPTVAAATGLPAGLPVVAGAGDGVLSSLGSGAVASGVMTVMIGTSGATRLVVDRPVLDQAGRTWCYYLARGRWVAGAAINNGGLALQWVRQNLLPGPVAPADEFDFETLAADAQRAPPGAGGLLFLPYFTGERSPYWNANARGVLFGMAAHMGPPHVARAAFEGVCYRMRSIVEALDEAAGPSHELRASGGLNRSPFWLQLLADVLGRPLQLPVAPQASAFGAAGLALLAIGAVADLPDLAARVPVEPGPTPDLALYQRYTRLYQLYQDVYWANQQNFAAIAALQDELS
jgi:gluconokinase